MTLKEKLARLKQIQDEHKGKIMPEAVAKEFEDLAREAEAEQKVELDAVERTRRVAALEDGAKRIPNPTMPADGAPADTKGQLPPRRIVGYMRLGEYVLAQKDFRAFQERGRPKGQILLAQVKSLFEPLVGLDAAALEEVKAVPTIGVGVIDPTLVADQVRVTEHDRLILRDVLDVQPTTKDAVKFTRITSYTRAAAAVAHSAQKPQAEFVMDAVTETVRTIAVWIPVEEQQLDDMPALAGLLNGELLYDVDKHVEELVMYGSGTGEEFEGIMINPLVQACRTVGGDTLIDIARRGITDVRVAGYEPNAIVVDPRDWETICLEKGSDSRYVWVIVTEGATQRLWGVNVVETIAMQDFQGVATEERNLVVGDFRRGATLWDRQTASISVGWINDQFIRNQRTILAELRAAFGVKRPGAFRKYVTQVASAS
jgi:HK97 family phage major capsid protein